MIIRMLQILLIGSLIAGCSGNLSAIENASVNYKNTKDFKSLEIIFKHLSKETPSKEAKRLLGEPDYSPTKGQYYYSSNKSEYSKEQDREVPLGLVVDYRDKNGAVTETLQEFWIGPIGE